MKKSTYSWIRGCITKGAYSDTIADAIIKKRKKEVTLYKYYCGTCGKFHLTRKDPAVKTVRTS